MTDFAISQTCRYTNFTDKQAAVKPKIIYICIPTIYYELEFPYTTEKDQDLRRSL